MTSFGPHYLPESPLSNNTDRKFSNRSILEAGFWTMERAHPALADNAPSLPTLPVMAAGLGCGS